MAVLIEIRGDQQREYRLANVTGIGRAPSNVIQLQDPLVSAEHVKIERNSEGAYEISDLGSTHGTFVNTSRIDNGTLSDGDEVIIGATRLRFHHSFESVGGRRWSERIPCDLPVQVSLPDGKTIDGRLFDASIVGVGLLMEAEVQLDASIDLAINFPGHLRKVKASGRVARIDDEGFGIALVFGSNRSGLTYAKAFAELLRDHRAKR